MGYRLRGTRYGVWGDLGQTWHSDRAGTGLWKHGMGMKWHRAGTGIGMKWDRAGIGRVQVRGTGGSERGQCGCEGHSPTPSAAPRASWVKPGHGPWVLGHVRG